MNEITQSFNFGFKKVFHFLGCWQGFSDLRDSSKMEEIWDNYITNLPSYQINAEILTRIKFILFKRKNNIKNLNKIFRKFFNEVFSIKF
jgi:hypothetical protein